MMNVHDADVVLSQTWRRDRAAMLGVLVRRLGDLDLAEDALQDAGSEALRTWRADGVPTNPSGWLVTTAWRRAIDAIRRDAAGREKLSRLAAQPALAPVDTDALTLIFGCCHPHLPVESQIALTLRGVCGMRTEEVAAALLVTPSAMAQRLVRAKKELRRYGVPFALPPAEQYADRLQSVLTIVYLIFNEGYLASGSGQAQRRDLARQAVTLAEQLCVLMPTEPEPMGLLALLQLHESRAATRFDPGGHLVLLAEQDRHRWNQPLIRSGLRRLSRAMAYGRPGRFQLEAAIAAQHAVAPTAATTDWPALHRLYQELYRWHPSPLVQLSAAVVTWHVRSAADALAEVEPLAGALGEHRLFHAARAELLRDLGRSGEARQAASAALALAENPAERELLARRLSALPA